MFPQIYSERQGLNNNIWQNFHFADTFVEGNEDSFIICDVVFHMGQITFVPC